MKHEPKYLIQSNVAGVIFLNANESNNPTIVIDGKKEVVISEKQKSDYSDDLGIYGPKLSLVILSGDKKVSAKTETIKKEIETKLSAPSTGTSKEEVKAKVKDLKKKYSSESDKNVRKKIKKEIETLLETVNT